MYRISLRQFNLKLGVPGVVYAVLRFTWFMSLFSRPRKNRRWRYACRYVYTYVSAGFLLELPNRWNKNRRIEDSRQSGHDSNFLFLLKTTSSSSRPYNKPLNTPPRSLHRYFIIQACVLASTKKIKAKTSGFVSIGRVDKTICFFFFRRLNFRFALRVGADTIITSKNSSDLEQQYFSSFRERILTGV